MLSMVVFLLPQTLMRYTFKILILIALLCVPVFSQLHDEEFAVEAVYLRRNVEVAIPDGSTFRFDRLKDSIGFRVGYTHFFGRKDARGDVGIGIEGGASFSNVEQATADSGNVALGRAQFKLVLQRNKPDKKFRPFVKGTVGAAREQFKYRFLVSNGEIQGLSRGPHSWTYGFGGGFDIGKNRTRFRTGCEYFRTGFGNGSQHNAECSVGLVF